MCLLGLEFPRQTQAMKATSAANKMATYWKKYDYRID